MEQVISEPKAVKRKRLPRWAKIALSPLIVFALLAAVWGGWLLVAKIMLAVEVAKIRARGEPTCAADLARPPVPPERNAIRLLREAVVRLDTDCNSLEKAFERQLAADGWTTLHEASGVAGYPDLRQHYQKELATISEASRPALAMVRESRDRTECDWEIDYTQPATTWHRSDCGMIRSVVRPLVLSAELALASGRDSEAAEYVKDLFVLSDRARSYPLSTGYLIGLLPDTIGVHVLQRIYASWGLQANPSAASRRQLEELISLLRNEEALRKSPVDAALADRAIDVQAGAMTLLAGRASAFHLHLAWEVPEFRPFVLPVLEMDAARSLRLMSDDVNAARQTSYPAAVSKLAPASSAQGLDEVRSFWHPLSALQGGASLLYFHYQVTALRRMAAIALAIRLYELDNGHRPANLQELVGKYLKDVPADPFGKDGKPIRYLPQTEPPRLYSVNKDGVDDGGKYSEYSPVSPMLDLPFFLDRVPPPRPPRMAATSAAVQHEP